MRLPLLSGIIADESAEFLQSYPVNLEAVAVDNKIAKAQFRMTSGASVLGAGGPGVDRGGIVWNGVQHRVMGTKLVKVAADGAVTVLGDVGGEGPASLDYGFDRLGIRSGEKLFYWNGVTLIEVTDPDLGPVLDMLWIDGYFMTTDGTSVIVTELNDPTSVLPLKYGSAEEDPDMVTGLIKARDEAYVLGRNTIQVFRNVGGSGFPFATLKGASIPYGCVGPSAKCLYGDSFAFVGSARNESLGVYLAGSGSATRISSRAIDDELAKVADETTIILENRASRAEHRLLIHLPDKTLVFLLNASKELGEPVWYVAHSGLGQPYRPRNAIQAYGQTFVGDLNSGALGILTDTIATHFGEAAEWKFDIGLLYNEAKGGIVQAIELIGLPGRAPAGVQGTAFLSMTRDGETFSVERGIPMGTAGQRNLRLQWRPRVNFRNWIGFRFRGLSAAMPGFAACEADVRPLAA
jgi:hypothetical protein